MGILEEQAITGADTEAIGGHVRVVRSSGVERADFGDGGEDLAERLTAISRRYESIEDNNWGRLLDVARAAR